jgi:hypothetical protein
MLFISLALVVFEIEELIFFGNFNFLLLSFGMSKPLLDLNIMINSYIDIQLSYFIRILTIVSIIQWYRSLYFNKDSRK